MARTRYATGNPDGKQVGPVLVPTGTEIAGIVAWEQAGHGLIDACLLFRAVGGAPVPGSDTQTGRLTNNPNAGRVGSVLLQTNEVFIGLGVAEQAGFGIVNLRMKVQDRSGGHSYLSDPVSPNQDMGAYNEIEVTAGATAKGIVGQEQAGPGLIDIAIEFE